MQLSLISSRANSNRNKGVAVKNKCYRADSAALMSVQQQLDSHAGRKSLLSASKTVVFFLCASCVFNEVTRGS